MVKNILTNAGLKTLDTEEMLLAFENMIYKFAHNCNKKLSTIKGNVYEFDDYVQIGRIEAINAFRTYDVKNKVTFSSYLTNSLRYVYVHLVRDMNAKKRKVESPMVYLNQHMEHGEEIMEITSLTLTHKDEYFEDDESDLEIFLKENLSAEELECVSMGLKKKINQTKGKLKEDLEFAVESLSEFEDVEILTKAELAERLNLSRPTLNKRIKEAMLKTEELVSYYINNY